MITTCLGCALLAAWLAVPGAAARTVRMRLEPAAAALSMDAVAQAERRRRRRRSWIYLAIVIIMLALIIAAGYIARARGAVLTCAALNLA